MVVALVVAAARDGAPTHHPERALLAVGLLAALVLARTTVALALEARTRPIRRRRSPLGSRSASG